MDTKEAFLHFISKVQPKLSDEQKHWINQFFFELTKVQSDTVRTWVLGKSFPKGLTLLGLRVFLISIGYELTEFQNMQSAVLLVGRLVAFGMVDPTVVMAELDYPETWELSRHVNNIKKPPSEKLKMYQKFLETRSELIAAVETRMAEVKQRVDIAPSSLESKKTSEVEDNKAIIHITKHSLDAVAELCDALMPILNGLLEATDSGTRQKFRDEIKFFPLSNKVHGLEQLLNEMCSEKSREVAHERRS